MKIDSFKIRLKKGNICFKTFLKQASKIHALESKLSFDQYRTYDRYSIRRSSKNFNDFFKEKTFSLKF